jgi:hypothetical protein
MTRHPILTSALIRVLAACPAMDLEPLELQEPTTGTREPVDLVMMSG